MPVRDMLLRYTHLSEMTNMEELYTAAGQNPDTAGLPDVLKQLLAHMTA
jgi:hypothetical protein